MNRQNTGRETSAMLIAALPDVPMVGQPAGSR